MRYWKDYDTHDSAVPADAGRLFGLRPTAGNRTRHSLWCLCCLLACLLYGCSPQDQERERLPTYATSPVFSRGKPVYRFAVYPFGNIKRVFASCQPLAEIINNRAKGFEVRIVVPQNHKDFIRRLRAGEFPLVLADPVQTRESIRLGYRVVARMGDEDSFRGLIILRTDTDIHSARDLAGRPLSFPNAASFAATMLSKAFLHEQGLDLAACPMRYVGSHASALMSVYFGKTVAAGTRPLLWEQFRKDRPDIAAALKVGWATASFVTDALAVRGDMVQDHAGQLTRLFLGLHETPEGRAALEGLGLSRFEPGADDEYEPVAAFMRRNAGIFSLEHLSLEKEARP